MEKQCFIAGLPDTGKTTFIAALWDIIKRGTSDLELQFSTNPDDATYLNEIWEYWVSMKKIERSKKPIPDIIRINVKREVEGDSLVLSIPDFMGEQFQKIIDHTLPDNIKQWIAESDRMLYFINELDGGIKDDLEVESPDEEGIDREKEKESSLRLAPEKMMLASQNMMVLKYIASHSKVKRIAIGLSAWDRKMNSEVSAEEYLRHRSPVLYNFIKFHFPECVFFGVSAQGLDYKDLDEGMKNVMKKKTRESSRAFISFGQDTELSVDLTRPINYLIS